MDTLARSDAFFIITAIAVVVITVLLGVGIAYLISILRTVKRITRTAEETTKLVAEDISELREEIKVRGFNLRTLLDFFRGWSNKRVPPKK